MNLARGARRPRLRERRERERDGRDDIGGDPLVGPALPEGTPVFGVDAVQPPPAQAIRRPRGSLVHARRIGQPRAVAVGQVPGRVHDFGALQPFGLDARDGLKIHSLAGLGPGLRDESADDQRG